MFKFDSFSESSNHGKDNSKTLQRKESMGDGGVFLGQLIKILENPNRRDNTPLSLNATAMEYIAVYIDRSREIGMVSFGIKNVSLTLCCKKKANCPHTSPSSSSLSLSLSLTLPPYLIYKSIYLHRTHCP
jgi:hypothetical protein